MNEMESNECPCCMEIFDITQCDDPDMIDCDECYKDHGKHPGRMR